MQCLELKSKQELRSTLTHIPLMDTIKGTKHVLEVAMKGSHRYSRKTFRLRQEEMLMQLRDEILSGQRPSGQYLPSEKTLSELFGLSGKSVGSVLDVLVTEGLIKKIPSVGNVVIHERSEQGVTIKFAHHGTQLLQAEISLLLQAFNEQYPHIRIQEVNFQHHNPEELGRYMDDGLIDVMTLNDSEFRRFAEREKLDYFSTLAEKPEIYAFLSQAFSVNEKLYAQPFIFSPVVLCYNLEHFAEAGLAEPDSSWSWDDLFAAAEQLNIPNERHGFYFQPYNANRFLVFLLQSGNKFVKDENGRYRLCDSSLMDTLRSYRDIVTHRLPLIMPIPSPSFYTEDIFCQGKISMIFTTYYGLNYIREARESKETKVKFEIAPLPTMIEPVTLLHAVGLAVNKHSPHKEAAFKLVDFLTSHQGQMMIRQQSLNIPSFRPAANWTGEDNVYRPSRYNIYREVIPSFRLGNTLGLNEEQFFTFQHEVIKYWSGLESEDSFCKRLERLL